MNSTLKNKTKLVFQAAILFSALVFAFDFRIVFAKAHHETVVTTAQRIGFGFFGIVAAICAILIAMNYKSVTESIGEK